MSLENRRLVFEAMNASSTGHALMVEVPRENDVSNRSRDS